MIWIANVKRDDELNYRLNLPYKTEAGAPMATRYHSVQELVEMGYVGIYRTDNGPAA